MKKVIKQHEWLHLVYSGVDITPDDLADLCANLPPLPEGTKAKGLDFDENGKMIEDFSYLEKFES
jgi:hypothetical protein